MLKVKIKKKIPGFNLEVDFSINEEILAILGPSGSGKTITLKCVAGLLKPDEGYIELNGKVLFDSAKRIDIPARQRKIGFVFQNYALFPHLSVYENTAYGIKHLKKEDRKKRVFWLLEKMHIDGLGERLPKQLSSGQQQRVALARALCNEPELLLLDEPFSALDTPRRERLERELLTMQDFYKGDMLFVTHDLSQGYKLGSKIAIYESGHMVQCDNKHSVITSPNNLTVARLTGVKNLIEGYVSAGEGRKLLVTIPGIGELRLLNDKSGNFEKDQQVILGIRPEYIVVTGEPGENSIEATAAQVVEGVTSISYFFHSSSPGIKQELEVSSPRSEMLQISEGKSYFLHMPAERIVILKK
jgi:molybdate transport system ATP-binding protein